MVITYRKFRFKNHKREVLDVVVVEELKNKNKRIYKKKLSGG